jgi:uncharacterized protein (TIGR02118 family)
MVVISVVYPNRPDARFDADYYLNRHVPLAIELLSGAGLQSFRVVRGEQKLDGSAAPYRFLCEMTFPSIEDFRRGLAEHGAKMAADNPNFTDEGPQVQVSGLAVDWRAGG